tara:strand:- start:143 stop:319 length:177 start_codon:yes stop_codon:yes gene_type:complete
MTDEIIFEEHTLRNKPLENVLQKTLEFNEKYLDFLENKLKEMKTKRTELLDGRSTSSI